MCMSREDLQVCACAERLVQEKGFLKVSVCFEQFFVLQWGRGYISCYHGHYSQRLFYFISLSYNLQTSCLRSQHVDQMYC